MDNSMLLSELCCWQENMHPFSLESPRKCISLPSQTISFSILPTELVLMNKYFASSFLSFAMIIFNFCLFVILHIVKHIWIVHFSNENGHISPTGSSGTLPQEMPVPNACNPALILKWVAFSHIFDNVLLLQVLYHVQAYSTALFISAKRTAMTVTIPLPQTLTENPQAVKVISSVTGLLALPVGCQVSVMVGEQRLHSLPVTALQQGEQHSQH